MRFKDILREILKEQEQEVDPQDPLGPAQGDPYGVGDWSIPAGQLGSYNPSQSTPVPAPSTIAGQQGPTGTQVLAPAMPSPVAPSPSDVYISPSQAQAMSPEQWRQFIGQTTTPPTADVTALQRAPRPLQKAHKELRMPSLKEIYGVNDVKKKSK